jgi:hypothetical protein
VDTEPEIQDTLRRGSALDSFQYYTIDTIVSYQYFTCCPPDLPLNVNVDRHCSNSWTTLVVASSEEIDLNDNSTMICEDENQPYPRTMANIGASRESFTCCDSMIEQFHKRINFLDETECVPFRNKVHTPIWVGNLYGRIYPIACNNEDIYSEFQFPRKVEKTNPYGIQYYECCKTGSTTPPFINDSKLKITVYPQIAISTLAVLSCVILIAALLTPLWLRGIRANHESTDNNNNNNNDRNKSTVVNRTTNSSTEPAFSGYNFYLVFLTIPDIIPNICLLGMYSSYANQKYNPHFGWYHYFSSAR